VLPWRLLSFTSSCHSINLFQKWTFLVEVSSGAAFGTCSCFRVEKSADCSNKHMRQLQQKLITLRPRLFVLLGKHEMCPPDVVDVRSYEDEAGIYMCPWRAGICVCPTLITSVVYAGLLGRICNPGSWQQAFNTPNIQLLEYIDQCCEALAVAVFVWFLEGRFRGTVIM